MYFWTVAREGVDVAAKRADNERHPLRHQAGDKHDIAAEPVELGDGDLTLGLLRRFQCGLQFGPTIQCIAAFAGLDLCELGDDLEAFSGGKRLDSRALAFQAEAGTALLLGRDAIVGDQR